MLIPNDFEDLADDDRFTFSIVDQMEPSIIPFQNHSSIIMWSAGGETKHVSCRETYR